MDDETVANFVAITGASEAVAQQVLEIAGNDLAQAAVLYFDNPEAFNSIATASTSAAPVLPEIGRPSIQASTGHQSSGGRQDARGVIHIDSDDDDARMDGDDFGLDDVAEAATVARTAQEEEDAAMAKRLQEELYAENANTSDGIRAPIARTTETLLAPSYGVDLDDEADREAAVMEQLRRRRQASARAQRPSPFSQNAWASGDPPPPSENGDTSQSRAARLADMYRPPFELLTHLSWDDARTEGREQKRWILVNIQDMADFSCQVLNRDIWKDEAVQQIVKESFIFLQYTKDDPEAFRYIQYYMQEGRHENPDNYPHVGIVDPRTGEQVKVWSGRPFPDALDFYSQLVEFLDRYSLAANSKNPVAKTKTRPPAKDVGRMTEDEMLEMALRNSLEGGNGGSSGPSVHDPDELTSGELDKGKGKAADTPIDLTGSPVEPEPEAAATQSAFAGISAHRPHVEPAADPATTTRIQFRHSGGRVIRRFGTGALVVRIYEWLKAEPLEGKEGVEFELKIMPQARDLIDDLGKTIEEAGLKQATVMIEYVE